MTPADATPDDLRGRLRRLRREEEPRVEVARTEPPREGLSEGPPAALFLDGACAARCTTLPTEGLHGCTRLDAIDGMDPTDLELLTGDGSLRELDPRRAVYLDTETTGLAGGAGTYVFLVGLGRFVEGGAGFEVWQGFLRGPEDEPELLAECARRLRTASAVVSFFGKSFDRHRLEDKMRLVGVEPPFADLPHLDLYHPLRRLYGGAYADGRLKTLEHELCGVEREDDLPGSEAPAAWFDYLAERPHRLEGVFRHNLDDVLSLVTLAAHLGRASREEDPGGGPLRGDAAARAAGLGRSHEASGDRARAVEWLGRAVERGHPRPRPLLLSRARLARREGRGDLAEELLRALVRGPEDASTAPALVELAMLLEHTRRDLSAAAEACRLARVSAERTLVGRPRAALVRDVEARLARLTQRSARAK